MAIKTGWATALSAIIGALKNRDLSRGFQPSANGGVKNTMTNADLIRAMTDAELSVWLSKISVCCEFDECPAKDVGDEPSGFVKCTVGEGACITAWLNWLRQEVDE